MRYGIAEAREILRQGGVFVGAVREPSNAAAKAMLAVEDLTDAELGKGEHLVAEAKAALAGSEGSLGTQVASTDHEGQAFGSLRAELASRLKKTRAKLGEHPENQFLLDALNTAVRHAGRSLAAAPARTRAFIKAVGEEHQDPVLGGPVTIKQRANITDVQLGVLQKALDAVAAADTSHQSALGSRVHLTQEKEKTIRALDRWLAKWQQIAKADFDDDQLKAFGIPANVHASRIHKHQAAPQTSAAPPAGNQPKSLGGS
jgi:hypothetical protein